MNLAADHKQKALMKKGKLPNPKVQREEFGNNKGKGKLTPLSANHWSHHYLQTSPEADNYGLLPYIMDTLYCMHIFKVNF